MPVPKLDANACARRNAAASLQGRNAAPFRLSVAPPMPPDGMRVVTASGSLPANDTAAVALINENLGLTGTDDELPPEKVLLVYPEAANRNYIQKYCMFLGLSTLKNIRDAGQDGISLMNSHRTGGMSQPTELPYGRTFAGRLETLAGPGGERDHRVILGAYMISGLRPNGADGPSTDDLHASIVGGTIGDVSLGFCDAGRAVCDVCGMDMAEMDEDGEDYMCSHVPGTHRGMDAEMVSAQKARGVPDGVCTFTLEDSHVNELSAVYAGALPGAGFRKSARLARKKKMGAADLASARLAFAPSLSAAPDAFGPVPARQPTNPVPPQAGGQPATNPQPKGHTVDPTQLADAYAFWLAAGRPASIDLAALETLQSGATPPPTAQPKPATANPPRRPEPEPEPVLNDAVSRQFAALRAEHDADRANWEAKMEKDRVARVAVDADAWVNGMVRLGQATAAERLSLVAQYSQADADDNRNPVQIAYKDPATQAPKLGSRLDVLKASVSVRPRSQTGQQLAASNPADEAAARAAALAAGPDPATLANGSTPKEELDSIYQLAVAYGKRLNGSTANQNRANGSS